MKIDTQTVCAFELDSDEKKVLDDAADLIYNISISMKHNNCEYLITGYTDSPISYSVKALDLMSQNIDEIKNAYEIRKDAI